MSAAPLLRMRGICKAFAGVQALRDAQLEVQAGEVHVLLGENGAGKSTLMKILCGQYSADAGSIELDGAAIAPSRPDVAERLGLVMIHQELNLVDGLSVADNIFLGHEPSRAGLLDAATMRQEARALLRRLRCDLDPTALVGSLSVAQKQLVEIAKALLRRARVLVMDEPTAALSGPEISALFALMRSLCAEGVAIVYISHRMEEIFAIGDRITIMRDGRFVGMRQLAGMSVDELIRMMVGRTIAEQIPKRTVSPGDVLLRAESLRTAHVRADTFTVRAGEILGVAGLMGSGRTELVRALFGADPLLSGRVVVGDRSLTRFGPRDAIGAGIGFITEDRKGLGLVLQCSVAHNITLTRADSLARLGVLRQGAARAMASRLVERLRIRVASLDQPVLSLSGGNQQKVVLAKWLAAQCRVLIFDEPTRGIDVGAKAEIYDLLGELAAQGTAIVLVSSELPEVLGLADRVLVMHEGKTRGILERAEATQESIMRLALGQVAAPLDVVASAPLP